MCIRPALGIPFDYDPKISEILVAANVVTAECKEFWQLLLWQGISTGFIWGMNFALAPAIISRRFEKRRSLAFWRSSLHQIFTGRNGLYDYHRKFNFLSLETFPFKSHNGRLAQRPRYIPRDVELRYTQLDRAAKQRVSVSRQLESSLKFFVELRTKQFRILGM